MYRIINNILNNGYKKKKKIQIGGNMIFVGICVCCYCLIIGIVSYIFRDKIKTLLGMGEPTIQNDGEKKISKSISNIKKERQNMEIIKFKEAKLPTGGIFLSVKECEDYAIKNNYQFIKKDVPDSNVPGKGPSVMPKCYFMEKKQENDVSDTEDENVDRIIYNTNYTLSKWKNANVECNYFPLMSCVLKISSKNLERHNNKKN